MICLHQNLNSPWKHDRNLLFGGLLHLHGHAICSHTRKRCKTSNFNGEEKWNGMKKVCTSSNPTCFDVPFFESYFTSACHHYFRRATPSKMKYSVTLIHAPRTSDLASQLHIEHTCPGSILVLKRPEDKQGYLYGM